MQVDGPPVNFLNVEYFFRLIYGLFSGGAHISGNATGSASGSGFNFDGVLVLLSHIWLLVTILSFLFSLATIGVFVYATMRIYQIRKDEESLYATKSESEEHTIVEHERWTYIMQLVQSGQETDWRQAIIECDIMLGELLDRLGYIGESLGEKLRSVNAAQFQTLSNAWEAHRVRNEIAHQGSAYQLSENLAHRTIANYEAVFREHGEI